MWIGFISVVFVRGVLRSLVILSSILDFILVSVKKVFIFKIKIFLILISMRFDVLFEVVGFFEVFLIEVIFVGSVYIVCFF